MSKKVLFWDTTKYLAPNTTNTVGKFRTRVNSDVSGAINFKGENNAGITWDYWALLRDTVSGKVKWIDKVSDEYKGASIVLYLESEKFLHKVSLRYDATPCRDILNRLLGLGDNILTQDLTLSYWVRNKVDDNKNIVRNDKGQPILLDNIIIKDVKGLYTDWKKFSAENGLEWKQSTDAKGKKSYDMSAELKFWDEKIAELQLLLLRSKTALPFSYNSYICSEIPNPSGAANLPAKALEYAKTRYEEIKGDYVMPFFKKEQDADDIDLESKGDNVGAYATPVTEKEVYTQPVQTVTNTPTSTPPVAFETVPDLVDDLPF